VTEARCIFIHTRVYCEADPDWPFACCSFGRHVLVMSCERDRVFAALVDVDGGPLSKSTIHITEFATVGDTEWLCDPHLCSISESRAVLRFDG